MFSITVSSGISSFSPVSAVMITLPFNKIRTKQTQSIVQSTVRDCADNDQSKLKWGTDGKGLSTQRKVLLYI